MGPHASLLQPVVPSFRKCPNSSSSLPDVFDDPRLHRPIQRLQRDAAALCQANNVKRGEQQFAGSASMVINAKLSLCKAAGDTDATAGCRAGLCAAD
jgi:hypothetical protein